MAAAQKAKSYEEFKKQANLILSQERMSMSPDDVSLAEQLHLDKSPRENADNAMKKLLDLDKDKAGKEVQRVTEVLMGLSFVGPVATILAKNYTKQEYEKFMSEFSDTPVLDEYRNPKEKGFVVPVPESVRLGMKDEKFLKSRVWSLYHPGTE